jgi:hypothetical protein
MKSRGQIDGQMSSQLPVVWWYREVNCEVMCLEAVPVLGVESEDFLFNYYDLKIFGTYHGASVIMRRTFPWKRSSVKSCHHVDVSQEAVS